MASPILRVRAIPARIRLTISRQARSGVANLTFGNTPLTHRRRRTDARSPMDLSGSLRCNQHRCRFVAIDTHDLYEHKRDHDEARCRAFVQAEE